MPWAAPIGNESPGSTEPGFGLELGRTDGVGDHVGVGLGAVDAAAVAVSLATLPVGPPDSRTATWAGGPPIAGETDSQTTATTMAVDPRSGRRRAIRPTDEPPGVIARTIARTGRLYHRADDRTDRRR
jgi:hypothetical protein